MHIINGVLYIEFWFQILIYPILYNSHSASIYSVQYVSIWIPTIIFMVVYHKSILMNSDHTHMIFNKLDYTYKHYKLIVF